jgi:uncharacterized protein (TIGR03437 family)
MLCGILAQPILLAADVPGTQLVLQVSTESAPPGASAQIKIFATSPALIATGSIAIDFDPAVFGNVAAVSVFSSTGDQIGYTNVQGQHIDAHFSSVSGGIGQLPGIPVLVVSVPVLATAKPGAITQVTANITDATGVGWTDPNKTPYAITVNPANFTVGGNLSVSTVVPGGGLLPQGTVITLNGTGFQPSTTLAIDGVAVSSVQYISPQQMTFTLGGAAELTGKRVHVANANGDSVDYFAALPSASATPPQGFTVLPGIYPILPLATYTNIQTYTNVDRPPTSVGYALLNPSSTPVTVSLESAYDNFSFESTPNFLLMETLTIPPGTLYFLDGKPILTIVSNLEAEFWITSSAPIRMITYAVPYSFGSVPIGPPGVSIPALNPTNPPALQVQVQVLPPTVSWSWQVGSPQPAPFAIRIDGNVGFTTSIQPSSATWFSVTPASGTAPALPTLTPNFTGLTPGTYTATLTVTPVVPSSLAGYTAKPTTITVSVTVTAAPVLMIFGGGIDGFSAPGSNGSSPPQTLKVTTNGNPAPFTVSIIPGTGGNWLTVTPTSGTTPAPLTVSANPAGLADGEYTSQIVLQGPANTLTIPVALEVHSPPPPPPPIQISPSSLFFVLASGSGPYQVPQVITIHPNGVSFSAVTQSGGNWMSTALFVNDSQTIIQVNASAAGLAAGTYQGTITITMGTLPPAQVAVTLTVIPAATTQTVVTATPSSVSVGVQSGTPPPNLAGLQSIAIDSGGVPVLFTLTVDPLAPDWLQPVYLRSALPNANGQVATPATISLGIDASSLLPGIYRHRLTLTWATGSLVIPVTLTVTPTASQPPILSALVNAASVTAGSIAPGEIIAIFGTGLGSVPTGLTLGASGRVATNISGAQVLINGIPAPLLYVSSTQVNAIVPYEVGTTGSASIEVLSGGVPSGVWNMPVAEAAPGIFSIGLGQAAVLNQDNSVNGPSNPAPRGTVIQIFATGEGLTVPPGITGSVTGSNTKNPVLPVKVTMGGLDAAVQYAGSAPDAVAGLLQVNALVPAALNLAPPSPFGFGPTIPITFSVNGIVSNGLTIYVD